MTDASDDSTTTEPSVAGRRSTRSPVRAWTLAAIVAALALPAAAIIAGLTVASGSGSPATATAAAATRYAPVRTPTPSSVPTAPRDVLPPGQGALVALVLHPTTMRVSPGGRKLARIATKTAFGSPQVVSVVKHSPTWLGVISSDAGNGRIGWIRRSDVSLSRVQYEIRVSLHTHTVTVWRSGHVVHRYDVAIGQPSAPTPTGRFAVTDRLTTGDPSGPYGCCILALSAHAPHAIQGWSGGDRIAIHSTPDTSSIGLPVSHGCLRLTLAEGRWLIDHVPLGTPTIIRE
jgi:lipoprotein-anchoring transpeptidase ErfK/SrfK